MSQSTHIPKPAAIYSRVSITGQGEDGKSVAPQKATMPSSRLSTSKRAAIYTRVSSLQQERHGASLETQEAACRQYCAGQGWLVLESHVYRETHKRSLLHERPLMTRLREAAREGAFDIVVCYCVDRLSSQDAHVYILDEEFGRAGVEMAFATEDFEQSAIGRFVRSAKVLAAAIEVEKIRERTVRGRIARVQSGKLIPGARPLYGYQWGDERDHKGKLIRGRLVEDPATAPTVRRIFKSLASGCTLRSIAKALTDEGIPTPIQASAQWQVSTVARIAHVPAYKGEAYGWGIRKGGATPQHFDPEKAIAMPAGTIPSIIDAVTWNAVQTVMARNKERAVRNAKDPESALLRGGYVRCGYCGAMMYPRPRSNGRIDYVCKSTKEFTRLCPCPTIVTHALDMVVWAKARKILTKPETVAAELQRLKNDDPTAHDLQGIDQALASLEKRKAMLVKSISLVTEADAAAPLVAHLDELARQERTLKSERMQMLERQRAWQEQQQNLESLTEWCRTVSANLEQFDFSQRRMVLDALGMSAKVFRADHEPRFIISAEIDLQTVSTTN
jgi:site-specific DNA recombinase